MPVVTKFPVSNQAAGSPFNGAWTNPNNAHTDNAVYATAAPGKNQEFATVWSVPFSTTDVPNGATVNSVTVEVQWKVSTTSSVATLRSTAFADSAATTAVSAEPGVNDTAEPTADTIRTYTATPSLAQLRDLWVRVQMLRGNSNTAVTASLDYLKVTVNYTDPPAGTTGSGGVAFGTNLAGSGAQTFTGTGATAFGFGVSGSGTYTAVAITGTGAIGFGFDADGTGSYTPAAITGTGDSAFGFATEGEGTVADGSFTGSGAIGFGFSLDGSGAQVFTGSGSTSFGVSLSGEGTVTAPSLSGSGGVAFGFATTGSGTYAPPAITGSGEVTFGFTLSGSQQDDEDGPWISHGVVHIGHPPLHH